MTHKTLFVLAALCITATLFAQAPLGDFECDAPGTTPDPTCEGWTRVAAGVHTICNTTTATVTGMPSSSAQFYEIAAVGTQLPYTLGSTTPVYPLTGASESNLTVTATSGVLSLDYVWAAFNAAAGGPSFFQILVVDPTTNAIIMPIAFGDATTVSMAGPPVSPSFGGTPNASTGLQSVTVNLPAPVVGTQIKIVLMAGETQPIFIAPISYLYVDNVRFGSSAAYPGNGSDCAITTSVNGTPSSTDVNSVTVNDIVGLSFDSPGGTLTGVPLLAFFQAFTTGNVMPQEPVTGLYFDFTLPAAVIADGFSNPAAFLNPVLGAYQTAGSLPPSAAGTSTSLFVNLLVLDPSQVFVGIADAHVLEIQ